MPRVQWQSQGFHSRALWGWGMGTRIAPGLPVWKYGVWGLLHPTGGPRGKCMGVPTIQPSHSSPVASPLCVCLKSVSVSFWEQLTSINVTTAVRYFQLSSTPATHSSCQLFFECHAFSFFQWPKYWWCVTVLGGRESVRLWLEWIGQSVGNLWKLASKSHVLKHSGALF